MRHPLLAVVIVALALSACGTKRQTGICADSFIPNASEQGDAAALDAAGDAAWEQRKDVTKLKEAIAAWQKAVNIDPKRNATRVKLSRARYLYGDGHLRADDDAEEAMIAEFDKGTRQAEMAFAQQSEGYRADFCAEKPYEEAIKKATKADVPAMYWYATNLGKWGLAKGLFTILKYKDNIKAMMTRLQELDSAYFYHAPSRYFGVFYTKIPFPGGDEQLSAKNFDASIAGSPQYLATKVLYASAHATKWKKRLLFFEMLTDVKYFPIEKAPELDAENTIEKRKAAEFLEDIDTFFGEPDEATKAKQAEIEAKVKAKYAAAAPAAAPADAPAAAEAPAATDPATADTK